MPADPDTDPTRKAMREFALACRAERDRLALSKLQAEDRRFETDHASRSDADAAASRLIETLLRPR